MILHGLQVPPLPHPLTCLVGRERDVADVITLLTQDRVRLITLTGVGGVGKSRVALEVAHEIGSFFSDRVFLIDFASVGDPTLLAPTIAIAVGLAPPTDGSSLIRLKRLIGEQRALIVVDNVDRVAASASPLTELLAACPHLAILATSRSRLRLHGEVVRQILPLPVPQPGDGATVENASALPAVRMFVERGREVDHRFALTAENVTDVADIVRRLDGLPLAIELAAARLDLLSPVALLARLQQRLPLLTGGAQDQPSRLRTMHDAIAWSYDLLELDERGVFERLALFADSIPLAGAVAICGDGDELAVLALLASLADKSLLIRDPAGTGEPWFRMLPTIREFALGQLRRNGAEDEAMRRLASWCLDVAEAAAAMREKTSGTPQLIAQLDLELDTFRDVLAWMEQQDRAEDFLRLAAALGWFWLHRSYRSEGRRWLDSAIAQGIEAEIRTVVLARAFDGAGVLAFAQGDYERASGLISNELALSRELGDRWGIAGALNLLGALDRAREDFAAADAHFAEALAGFQELGDPGWIALATLNLGTVAYWRHDPDRANALMQEALAHYQGLDDAYGMAITLSDLGRTAADFGDVFDAARHFRESLEQWLRIGTKEGLIDWLTRVATLASHRGDADLAIRLFSAAETLRMRIGYAFDHPERTRQRHALEAARLALGEERSADAWASGRALDFDAALAEATAFLVACAAVSSRPAAGKLGAPAGLTPREMDVLRLLVEGQSDRKIGDQLFISHRTVMRHVENILGKLQVESRTAAAMLAVREGFI
jgi:predicted ATPase/DNA-binding CsgD family transcriptional regulator